MKHSYFVTGISTDVGKTVISAVITQALGADYWKPVQAGDLNNTDLHKVKSWVTNTKSKFHESRFNLNTPMSPHAAAAIDGIHIELDSIQRPSTKNSLVIEGAGGWLVPYNDKHTMDELADKKDRIILVSRHYLGSINHTLLSVEAIRSRGFEIFGIIFVGEEHPTTEKVIADISKVPILGRMDEEPYIDSHVINEYAVKFKDELTAKR